MADSVDTTISTRRAILAGIPAAAAGVGALALPAAAAAPPRESNFTRLIRDALAADQRLNDLSDADENSFLTPTWSSLVREATKLRVEVAQAHAKTFEELRLKAAVFLGFGLEDEIQSDVEDGRAYMSTVALSLVRDFIALYGASPEPAPVPRQVA